MLQAHPPVIKRSTPGKAESRDEGSHRASVRHNAPPGMLPTHPTSPVTDQLRGRQGTSKNLSALLVHDPLHLKAGPDPGTEYNTTPSKRRAMRRSSSNQSSSGSADDILLGFLLLLPLCYSEFTSLSDIQAESSPFRFLHSPEEHQQLPWASSSLIVVLRPLDRSTGLIPPTTAPERIPSVKEPQVVRWFGGVPKSIVPT